MSEYINNREYRQKVLKELITELHGGKTVEEVKPRFEHLIEGISAAEISEMEQSLIMEGMPIEEIQRLCDVHAAVFKGSIEEIHKPENPDRIPGHPVHTFRLENREMEKLIQERIRPDLERFRKSPGTDTASKLAEDFFLLGQVDRHYSRKENLLFPYLEKYGITAPPKVMWGVDDEVRSAVKATGNAFIGYAENENPATGGAKVVARKVEDTARKAEEAITRVTEMIFKEENILFPMAMETLSEDQWVSILNESGEIGYTLIEPRAVWKPARENVEKKQQMQGEHPSDGYVRFDTGVLLPEEINLLFNHLPFDITYVDKDGAVKYFSQGKERIFARTKAIIGRKVQNCHPPASMHIVEKLVEDLKSGKKDQEDFWIRMGDRFVYIRYFAVRNEKGEYMGTMEVTQDIAPIQRITGEKRLMSDAEVKH